MHLEPWPGVDLVRADHRADAVVEYLRRCAGQRPEPRIPQAREVVRDRQTRCRGTLPDLKRREGVHVDVRHGVLHRPDHRQVVVTVEPGMNSALQTDLGRAPVPGLQRSPGDLLQRYEVRLPPQIACELPLGERAEPAAEIADIGVLDVARDDVADVVPAHLPSFRVRGGEDAMQLLIARSEQAHELVLSQFVAGVDRQRVARNERHRALLARRPVVGPSQSRAHPTSARRTAARRCQAIGTEVRRAHREPRREP